MDKCANYLLNDTKSLGRGSFGEVFECELYNLSNVKNKLYARKYFSLCPDYDNSEIREIADLRQRFNVEIKSQCLLNSKNYDCIAPIVLFNTCGESPYFVMELAEMNLLDAIANGMTFAEKTNAVTSVIEGVKTIHENNYLHRDLNPKNILKYQGDKFKITDFGLVKDLNSLRAEIKTKFVGAMGTDGYMAPEVQDSGVFSVQSDIYSVGKIISKIHGDHEVQIRHIIRNCTNYFPEDRYKNAEELINDYRKVINAEDAA